VILLFFNSFFPFTSFSYSHWVVWWGKGVCHRIHRWSSEVRAEESKLPTHFIICTSG